MSGGHTACRPTPASGLTHASFASGRLRTGMVWLKRQTRKLSYAVVTRLMGLGTGDWGLGWEALSAEEPSSAVRASRPSPQSPVPVVQSPVLRFKIPYPDTPTHPSMSPSADHPRSASAAVTAMGCSDSLSAHR